MLGHRLSLTKLAFLNYKHVLVFDFHRKTIQTCCFQLCSLKYCFFFTSIQFGSNVMASIRLSKWTLWGSVWLQQKCGLSSACPSLMDWLQSSVNGKVFWRLNADIKKGLVTQSFILAASSGIWGDNIQWVIINYMRPAWIQTANTV